MQRTHDKFNLLALGLVSLVVFSVLAQAPPGENGLEMIAGDGQTPALLEVPNASQDQSLCALTGLADGLAAEIPDCAFIPICPTGCVLFCHRCNCLCICP